MIQFSTVVNKFRNQGEKTGWTYIEIPAATAQHINPRAKTTFRVRGSIDGKPFQQMALLPMGNGNFIMALNAAFRKTIGKIKGAKVEVKMEQDESEILFNEAFMDCLKDDREAIIFFNKLSPGHRRYFNKWIESAKTTITQTDRIAKSLNALAKGQDFGQMLRSLKKDKIF